MIQALSPQDGEILKNVHTVNTTPFPADVITATSCPLLSDPHTTMSSCAIPSGPTYRHLVTMNDNQVYNTSTALCMCMYMCVCVGSSLFTFFLHVHVHSRGKAMPSCLSVCLLAKDIQKCFRQAS